MILSNLHLKFETRWQKPYGTYIEGAIFKVSIVISGLLSLPSCYLGNEVAKKLKTKNGQNMLSGPFSHDAAHMLKGEN